MKTNTAVTQQFTLPTEITLEMYQLDNNGAIIDETLTCETGSFAYGCTYFDGIINQTDQIPYPFSNNTITIGIESHLVDGVQQGYLHNVISQEMIEGAPLPAYVAQAIASRSFIYYHIQNTAQPLNNSTQLQAFIPFRFAGLGGATPALRRDKVDNAITLPGPLYLTTPDNTDPLRAHFGADNCTYTTEGDEPHLKSVYDPISAKPDPCDNATWGTGFGGLESAGAARWAFGTLDEYGQGEVWSVRWDEGATSPDESWRKGLLIALHYFSEAVVRDKMGTIITPLYRWNPLKAVWGVEDSPVPPPMRPGNSYLLQLCPQNTGIAPWDDTIKVSYYWLYQGQTITNSLEFDAPNLTEGAGDEADCLILTLTVPDGLTDGLFSQLVIDFYSNTDAAETYFHNREVNKSWFPLVYNLCIGGDCAVYLPLAAKSDSLPTPTPTPLPTDIPPRSD